jgi:hypothetical protein
MRPEHGNLVLPLGGAGAMAVLLWKSLFLSLPLGETEFIWLVVFLLPFVIASLITFRGTMTGQEDVLAVGRYFSLLLGAPAVLCLVTGFTSGEGLQYLLALSPLYSWPVTAIMIVFAAVVGAFKHDLSAYRARNF